MNFTFEQSLRYYQHRLPNDRLSTHREQMVSCPFPYHSDRTPSFSLNIEKATWFCHGCKKGGGIYQFEAELFPDDSPSQHWEHITEICGLEPHHRNGSQPKGKKIATHPYFFADGMLAFLKDRYAPATPDGKKSFSFRVQLAKGWAYTLDSMKNKEKPLYRLPELVKCNVAFIAEGEPKVDALMAINWAELSEGTPVVAATCNFDGAKGWKDYYAPYFTGKRVFIFSDNDDTGREHVEMVARSLVKFALSIRIVDLPGLEEHGDVVDFLKEHTKEELLECIKKSRRWDNGQHAKEEPEQPWLVSASHMVVDSGHLDWLVPGIVHRFSKGIFVACPKAGKSLTALDMAVALASNQSWCGCPPAGRPVRCAVISREDPAFITQHRTFEFARGRGIVPGDLEEMLLFNTRDQSRSFYLENDNDCATAIKWIRDKNIEFAIFDVLNLLHNADENSNTEMTAVMKRLSFIRDETNISLVLIHHTPHSDAKRARGAGAIESWWEWKVVVQPDPVDDSIKTLSFISKACRPHPSIQVFIREVNGGTRLIPSLSNGNSVSKANGAVQYDGKAQASVG